MKICIDGFGGDNSPLAVLQAATQSAKELNIEIVITGNEKELKKTAEENNIALSNITFADAASVISVDEEPNKILKEYKDSSMAVGLKLLADNEVDAFVSAGSTGALIFGSTFIVKRIKGVKRPVISVSIPGKSGYYTLLDCGANSECRAEMLVQFAKMGSIYHKAIFATANPKVGLINIGTEETKGDTLRQEAFNLLNEEKNLNFIGNVEARDLSDNICDVAVCDGFMGNVLLKMTEGLAHLFMGSIKDIFYKNFLTKLSALMIKKQLKDFKKKFDYKEVGGTPILGVNGVVIKAHGSSDAKALKNAILQAKKCVENNIIENIKKKLNDIDIVDKD